MSAHFKRDGAYVVTSSLDNTVRIWSTREGSRPPIVLKDHKGPVSEAFFTSNGANVVTFSVDNTLRVWNAKTGEAIAVVDNSDKKFGWLPYYEKDSMITIDGDQLDKASFSPDGLRVVIPAADNIAEVMDVGSATKVLSLVGHELPPGPSVRVGLVTSAHFTPNGRRIITTGSDNTARVWNARTGSLLAVIQTNGSQPVEAVSSPDGSRLLTLYREDEPEVWDVSWASIVDGRVLVERICSVQLANSSAQSFTRKEMNDPILKGRLDLANPCERYGPLDAKFYTQSILGLWNWSMDWAKAAKSAAN